VSRSQVPVRTIGCNSLLHPEIERAIARIEKMVISLIPFIFILK